MILQKTISTGVVLALLFSSIIYTTTGINFAYAQSAGGLCALDAYPSVSIDGIYANDEESTVQVDLLVSNQSSYLYPDLTPFLALYASGKQYPSYILYGTDSYPLTDETQVSVGISADTAAVSAGTYELKAFVGQGDINQLLATAVREAGERGVQFEKQSEATSNTPMAITINGRVAAGEILQFDPYTELAVEAKTTNNNNRSFRDADVYIAITQGTQPVGTALSATKRDAVKLIPGSTRTTKFTDRNNLGGEYTLFATIDKANSFQPLTVIPMQLGEDSGDENFMYLTGVGIEKFDENMSLVTCVGRTDNSYLNMYSGQFAVTTNTGEQVEFRGVGEKNDYTATFTSSLSELQQGVKIAIAPVLGVSSPIDGEEVFDESDLIGDQYIEADSITVVFECLNGICDELEERQSTQVDEAETQSAGSESFYFYIGIIIAAALLGYIMLRRLPPEEAVEIEQSAPNDTELQ